jgi:hypothetical protein
MLSPPLTHSAASFISLYSLLIFKFDLKVRHCQCSIFHYSYKFCVLLAAIQSTTPPNLSYHVALAPDPRRYCGFHSFLELAHVRLFVWPKFLCNLDHIDSFHPPCSCSVLGRPTGSSAAICGPLIYGDEQSWFCWSCPLDFEQLSWRHFITLRVIYPLKSPLPQTFLPESFSLPRAVFPMLNELPVSPG